MIDGELFPVTVLDVGAGIVLLLLLGTLILGPPEPGECMTCGWPRYRDAHADFCERT